MGMFGRHDLMIARRCSSHIASDCKDGTMQDTPEESIDLHATYCGWTKSISHHFETMVETMVSCLLQGNRLIPGFLNGGA